MVQIFQAPQQQPSFLESLLGGVGEGYGQQKDPMYKLELEEKRYNQRLREKNEGLNDMKRSEDMTRNLAKDFNIPADKLDWAAGVVGDEQNYAKASVKLNDKLKGVDSLFDTYFKAVDKHKNKITPAKQKMLSDQAKQLGDFDQQRLISGLEERGITDTYEQARLSSPAVSDTIKNLPRAGGTKSAKGKAALVENARSKIMTEMTPDTSIALIARKLENKQYSPDEIRSIFEPMYEQLTPRQKNELANIKRRPLSEVFKGYYKGVKEAFTAD